MDIREGWSYNLPDIPSVVERRVLFNAVHILYVEHPRTSAPPGFEVLTGISKDGLDLQLLLLYICWISGRYISGGDNQSEKTTQATT